LITNENTNHVIYFLDFDPKADWNVSIYFASRRQEHANRFANLSERAAPTALWHSYSYH